MILTSCSRPRRHARPLLCLLAIALGGCSLAPVYQRPQTALPPTLGAATAVAATADDTATTTVVTLNPEEQRFVHAFSPQQDLTALVTQALAHAPDFRNTVLLVQQARAQYRIERAQQLPQLGINAQGVRQSYDNPATQARYGQKLYTAAVGVDGFELDLFGKLASLSAAAQQRYLASRYGQQAARGALIAEVLRAYTIERAAAQAEQRLQAIAEHTSALQAIANRQHEVGLLSTDALNSQRHQCDQAQVRALQASSDHAAARRALQLLTGYNAPDNAGTLQSLLPDADSANTAAWRELDSQLLLQRPDIQQAEAELRARNADIGAARAAFFPSIQLSTSLGTASDSLNGLFMPGSRSWSFIPQLLMPIFDAGRNRANLDIAQLRKDGAVADYEKAVEAAFREVADALDALPALQQREQRERANAERERQRVARLQQRVAQGLQDRTDLLAGDLQAEQAELEQLQARQALLLNRIALFHAFYGVQLPHAS
ncbi:efflux transporter outer membrane subunit [Xanthomonas albilineans]|uniref:efflux transporter outer membrane subunit n=1 Tax=Xanthomonas albilineans TaxID=29447 RepID=UPI0005F312CE|nr:efflux transporter outer membrane subunit [Xanthomonas albilineans]